jgi:hypothetical protein
VGALLRRFPQRWQAQLSTKKDAGQVDRAKAPPLGEAGGLDILAEKQTGVVDQDVEFAEAVDRRSDSCCPIVLARHVELHIKSRLAERVGCLAAAFVEHVADRHLGTGLDHQPCGFCADAARCPRYEGYLAIETVHCGLPRLSGGQAGYPVGVMHSA